MNQKICIVFISVITVITTNMTWSAITEYKKSPISYAIPNKKINDLALDFMKKNTIEGMSIAVINNNNIQFFNYGFANKIKNIATTNHTLYPVASFTKTFTATLTAIAATEEKLNLDDALSHYFNNIKNKNLDKILLSNCLGHVSSLPFDFNPRPKTYSDVVNHLKQFVSASEPGRNYAYSNAGIGIVGYVLQNVYAKDYQNILHDKLLRPLKMNSTYLIVPRKKEKFLAVGHDEHNNIVTYRREIDVWFAAASLKSTIADMAKYLYAHIHYASLNNLTLAKALLLVHENKYCFSDKISCEQLAWQAHVITELENVNGDTYFIKFDKKMFPIFNTKEIIENKTFSRNQLFIDKTASGYGMSSYMAYIPDKSTGVVIMANKKLGDERIKLGRDILKIL